MRARPRAVAGLTAVLLSACSGGGGGGDGGNAEAAKKGPQVAADAAAALERSGAAHLTGTVSEQGQTGDVDLHLQGADASGTITIAGQKVQLVSAGGTAYAKAPAAFWSSFGAPEAISSKLDDHWVVVPQQAAGSLGTFTLKGLADELRRPSNGTWKDPVGTATVAGQKALVVTESDGSTLDVAATGTPYPLKADTKGGESPGTLTFSDFGTRTTITAPAGALDLTQLGGG